MQILLYLCLAHVIFALPVPRREISDDDAWFPFDDDDNFKNMKVVDYPDDDPANFLNVLVWRYTMYNYNKENMTDICSPKNIVQEVRAIPDSQEDCISVPCTLIPSLNIPTAMQIECYLRKKFEI